MLLRERAPLRQGDLPPTIVSDVTKAYNADNGKFQRFWQITLKITDACALRCAYCTQYVENHSVELSPEFVSNFVEYIDSKSLSCGYLLTGGEPLHHKDISSILSLFSSSKTPFDINTSLATNQAKIKLLLSSHPRTVRFSLHSTNSMESNDFNGTNSWKTVTKNAALVANGAERPERVEVNTHVSNKNHRNVLNLLKWISSEFDVDDINIFPVYDFKAMQLSQGETQDFYNDILPRVIEFADGKNFQGLRTRAMRLLGDPTKYAVSGPRYVEHSHYCHAGRSILYIDNFQNVYPCVSQQIHRTNKAAKTLGRISSASDIEGIIARTPEFGFDPNENDVCVDHCPLFFSMVNQYVQVLRSETVDAR